MNPKLNGENVFRPSVTRRRLLQIGAGALAGGWLAGNLWTPAYAATSEDFAGVRERWRNQLTGGDALDPQVPEVRAELDKLDTNTEKHLASMERSAGRTYLWSNFDFTGDEWDQSFNMADTFGRLRQLALAYATKGTAREGDPELLEAVIDGLDWMYENKFNENVSRGGGSWYQFEIQSPVSLTPATLLLMDQLSEDRIDAYMRAVDHWCPIPKMKGANLLWTCQIVAHRAAIVEDAAKLTSAQEAIPNALEFVTTGDGFYTDGSFIQHVAHPYNGGYGSALVKSMSRLLDVLAGSPWALSGPGLENLMGWVEEGLEPWLHKGAMMGPVRGRATSNRNEQDHDRGANVTHTLLWLANSADPELAQHMRGVVKHTLQSDTFGNLFSTNELGTLVQLAQLNNDASVAPQTPLMRNKVYPNMDRVVHRRPKFSFALSMSSSRIYTYEGINDENRRGWHTGSGMHYLYNDDLAHYDQAFWATVDHTRLPGTTVPAGEWEPGEGAEHLTDEDWVGGVSLGTLGAAGMAFHTYSATDPGSAPRGKKSWFMFDDRIVVAGAGITSSSGAVIESIVENRRLLDAGQRLRVDGVDQGGDPAWERQFDNPTWAHLEGATPSAGIGYVFGEPMPLQAKRESRTGMWSDVNRNGRNADDTPMTREYLALWLDHGIDPVDASYSYTLLPGADAGAVRRYAEHPNVELVANTAAVQAARAGGTFAANFWNAEQTMVNGVTCVGAASVLVVQRGPEISVAVSDPTHREEGVVRLTIPGTARKVQSADPRITVDHLKPKITLTIDVGGSRGATLVAKLVH